MTTQVFVKSREGTGRWAESEFHTVDAATRKTEGGAVV